MKTETKIAETLADKGLTLSLAESCTGGLLSDRLTDIPGASDFLKLSVVAYSNEAKIKILKVSRRLLNRHGAVSEETAVAMARGVRKIHDTDFGIGITGVAGPSGGTKSKPVGLVFIAVATADEVLCLKCRFKGSRRQIKRLASTKALHLLREFLD